MKNYIIGFIGFWAFMAVCIVITRFSQALDGKIYEYPPSDRLGYEETVQFFTEREPLHKRYQQVETNGSDRIAQ